MKEKVFTSTFILSKDNKTQVVNWNGVASNKEDAIQKALVSLPVLDLILQGFSIGMRDAIAVDSSVNPINSEYDASVIYGIDGCPKGLYLNLDANYSEAFKLELQTLLSKHIPSLSYVFPKCIETDDT